jgi:hypothetical protein
MIRRGPERRIHLAADDGLDVVDLVRHGAAMLTKKMPGEEGRAVALPPSIVPAPV